MSGLERFLIGLQAWVTANQLVFALVLWPTITGIINWLWKPRTAVQYAEMPSWRSGLLKMIGGSGLDPRKVLQGAHQIITGKPLLTIDQATADDLLKVSSIKPPPPVDEKSSSN